MKKSKKNHVFEGWKEKTWHMAAGSYGEGENSIRNISYGALETFKILAKCEDFETFLETKYCKFLEDF